MTIVTCHMCFLLVLQDIGARSVVGIIGRFVMVVKNKLNAHIYECFIFFHFVGVVPGSTELELTLECPIFMNVLFFLF